MLNANEVNFEDIRIILCVQGYSINSKFVVRIIFTLRTKFYNFCNEDILSVNYLVKVHNGIPLNKQVNYGLMNQAAVAIILDYATI